MLTLEIIMTNPMPHCTFIDFCMVLAKMSHEALQSAGTNTSREQLGGFNGGQQKTRQEDTTEAVLEILSLSPPPLWIVEKMTFLILNSFKIN